jgi:hypothetical protein
LDKILLLNSMSIKKDERAVKEKRGIKKVSQGLPED